MLKQVQHDKFEAPLLQWRSAAIRH